MQFMIAVLFLLQHLTVATGFPLFGSQWSSKPTTQPKLQTAVFALGSFWDSEAMFGCLEGVFSTRVGYCGGQLESPDYLHPADHVEAVEVTYDPTVTSYSELLDTFWSAFKPFPSTVRGAHTGGQYQTIIFVKGTEEHILALESEEKWQIPHSMDHVRIVEFRTFHVAEDEHQKFQLRRHPEIVRCLDQGGSGYQLRSRFAARANAYVGGYCADKKRREIERVLVNLGKRLARFEADIGNLERI